MRKVIVSFIVAVAAVGLTASLAAGAQKSHVHSRALCGTLYTPPCTSPKATIVSIAACKAAGATVSFPIAVKANAGLRKVTVTFHGTTVKTIKFKGQPTSKRLTVGIHTAGLKPGVYTVTLRVTDGKGKTTTKSAHFSICHPKPVFTG